MRWKQIKEIQSLMFCITGKKKEINIDLLTIYFNFQSMHAWESTHKNHNEGTFNLQSFPSNFIILPMVLSF